MKYYLIAGEPSGDLHGSHLIRAIRAEDPTAEVRAWGGDLMAAAGATLAKHYRELAFMGVVEVIRNLPTILRNERFCRDDIAAFQPDRLVLIDYSGFNLRIAAWAKPAGFHVTYYISPQVWASRSSRVKRIRAYVDQMLVILPFEADWYAARGVPVTFVGHPLLDVVREAESNGARPQDAEQVVQERRTIALLPGSRRQEITVGLPLMLAAAARHPEHDYVIAGAPAQEESFYAAIIAGATAPPRVRVVMNATYQVLQSAHAAIVTSGTATLETALFGVPQVVVYRGNWLAYRIAKWMIANRIKYISLVNLVMDAPVVPELIQADFNPANLAGHLEKIIAGPLRDRQLKDLQLLRERLGEGGAAVRAARLITSS
ncbi:lipid-A-disaccharide synthase [Neolewinella lacunae]|uniref:Lipid-A-disaccharide synthase n=1 Tax=Neolewinella lacunae TaxID=1517758 RepID=A0A923PNZ4_9BACT|nr:lipid-A-disaccharide synthase [Neolewinella lacunae]MBC6994012.1 lipid-A-disaccharide synthase [Neolewinella lacunae]MDN3634682.1 lipid-A-disaccharide synthase [Neolewinella lacunae]